MTGHWFLDHLWIVPLAPFAGFLLISLGLHRARPAAASAVAVAAMGLSALVGWGAALAYFGHHAGETLVLHRWEWLRFSPQLVGHMGLLVDDISMVLVLVVSTISFFIHVYSQGYMHGDKGYRRFFAFLNLFSFSMLGLVLACSILQIFVFWELVGLSSFLLIGFYWEKPSAVAACKKAFIVTRFADLGFLIGLLLISYYAGGFDFEFLNSPATVEKLAGMRLPVLGLGVLPVAAVLIYCGAAGKSAMFPLHIWLPDAMEGPTPVSALIHAATMVVAGVYLVARLFPLFAATEAGIGTVMGIGTFTALFAAVIATTQFDIKRVLAFSTLSQLGYMMLALGVARMSDPLGFTASIFHLTTHACFKALLFLGAGSVIHAVHTNDLREMGGLRRHLPITHGTFLIACLAIAGVWPLSGFFSKDEILAAAWHSHQYVVFTIALGVAGLTAFYMFRLYFLTFWHDRDPAHGHAREDAAGHAHAHPHESPPVMWIPLVALAIPSLGAGFIPFGELVHRGAPLAHHGIDWAIAGPALGVGLVGIALAWFLYFRPNELPRRLAFAFGPLHTLVYRKFFVDEVYLFITHRVIIRHISGSFNWFDRHMVDGFMDLTAQATRRSGNWLRPAASGRLQTYLLWSVAGVVAVLGGCWLAAAWLGWAFALAGGAALLTVYLWQLALRALNRAEPLKRIERD